MLANLTEAQLDVVAGKMKFFDDDDVKLAITNENACNPVLRTSARAILEE